MAVAVVTDCTDPDPRVRLTQLSWRAQLLVEIEEKTEEIACRAEGHAYQGAGPEVAQARAAAEKLKELADLHTEDDLSHPAAVTELRAALATATALVQTLESRHTPSKNPAQT
ncbi:hypothetical protein [Streptomyces lydicus]|uniref:hypothetical protein n=1 Tax=Streptomyces lydicus TaxID=47763 RepID=UPI001013A2D4|nr:hypothetical protein [Streptomyces lydicus]MCZ1011931.1 hypothetical protein [Streptomyces lydicus]